MRLLSSYKRVAKHFYKWGCCLKILITAEAYPLLRHGLKVRLSPKRNSQIQSESWYFLFYPLTLFSLFNAVCFHIFILLAILNLPAKLQNPTNHSFRSCKQPSLQPFKPSQQLKPSLEPQRLNAIENRSNLNSLIGC